MNFSNKRPLIGVGVFICKDDNQILLGQRLNSHGAHTWSLPGGHLKFAEQIEQCAKREA